MAGSRYPRIELGREGGIAPSEFRVSGRFITVVGAVIDGDDAYFDNGVISGKSKAELGITFGPEVLRAMQGRRVLALWFAAAADESGKAGWLGLTVGEMRIDAAKKDGYRDVGAFQTKLMDAARGRVSVTQLKEPERKPLLALLAKKPELWAHALRSFRDTVVAAIPEADSLRTPSVAAGDAAAATAAGPPEIDIGAESGFPPATLRAFGRELAIVGCTVQDGKAVWDNGLLTGKSKVEQGIAFGAEPARAMGGKRVAAIWVSVARQEDGRTGWFGASMGEMRIDAAKKEGFRDLSAWTVKLNDAARGRVELWRLKPEEKSAVLGLLQAREDLWEACSENMRTASE